MFLLDFTSKEPIVSQIHAQIVRFIEAGILSPGDRLPSVRQLAQDNGINPNTVAKAYTMLEQSGVSRNEVLKLVKRLTASLTEYTENDDQLYRVRYTLGSMLEKSSGV